MSPLIHTGGGTSEWTHVRKKLHRLSPRILFAGYGLDKAVKNAKPLLMEFLMLLVPFTARLKKVRSAGWAKPTQGKLKAQHL